MANPVKLKYSASEEEDLTVPCKTPGHEPAYRCIRLTETIHEGKMKTLKVTNPFSTKSIFCHATIEERGWDTECRIFAIEADFITIKVRNQCATGVVNIHLYLTTEFEDCQCVQ